MLLYTSCWWFGTFRQGRGSSCLALHFPSQGTNAFYQSKPSLNVSSQATKMPVAQVLMKTSKFSLSLQAQSPLFHPFSLLHWQKPRAAVPAGSWQLSPAKSLQGLEHQWVLAAIPAPGLPPLSALCCWHLGTAGSLTAWTCCPWDRSSTTDPQKASLPFMVQPFPSATIT